MDDQLALFGLKPKGPDPKTDPLRAPALPPGVFLGTSSWTFEGWKGLVYHQNYSSKQAFTRESLGEYANHPLFGTVGIDSSYYNPLTRDQLRRYANQLPEGFRCIQKVWDELTLMTFPSHPRYGKRKGQRNPRFLDPELFLEAVYEPNFEAFADHLGAFVFEFAPMAPGNRPTPSAFAKAVDAFLEVLPEGPLYAFELRNKELLTPAYLEVLRHHGAIHVFNLWSYMPSIGQQMKLGDLFTGPAVVSRMMLTPGNRYADRVKAWSPFDRLQSISPRYRDEALTLIREALDRQLHIYMIINNKFEGCSPLSIKALAEALADPSPTRA